MPEGAEQERLAAWIERLARRFGTEPFLPHVTLVAGLEGPASAVLANARRAAATLRPFQVSASGVAGRPGYFRCFFARIVEDAALRAAHDLASRAFGREPDPSFLPHLSLVYGELEPERKQALVRELGTNANVRFEARRLHLWRTEGPVADWREEAAFALGDGSS
jgi:2'-5' RNA ligase